MSLMYESCLTFSNVCVYAGRDSIGWCRLVRPGSVIGMQQQYLVLYEEQVYERETRLVCHITGRRDSYDIYGMQQQYLVLYEEFVSNTRCGVYIYYEMRSTMQREILRGADVQCDWNVTSSKYDMQCNVKYDMKCNMKCTWNMYYDVYMENGIRHANVIVLVNVLGGLDWRYRWLGGLDWRYRWLVTNSGSWLAATPLFLIPTTCLIPTPRAVAARMATVRTRRYVCAYLFLSIYIYLLLMCACIYVPAISLCVCVCVCICIYICLYIYMYRLFMNNIYMYLLFTYTPHTPATYWLAGVCVRISLCLSLYLLSMYTAHSAPTWRVSVIFFILFLPRKWLRMLPRGCCAGM
jgi:hypothetical protein